MKRVIFAMMIVCLLAVCSCDGIGMDQPIVTTEVIDTTPPPYDPRVTRIIRTSPRTLIFGAFRLVVLTRLIPCVVLRTKNHLKIKALGSEIFWLTNIRQQQENADDSILIHSRRLTN